jgi:hypothetical protein
MPPQVGCPKNLLPANWGLGFRGPEADEEHEEPSRRAFSKLRVLRALRGEKVSFFLFFVILVFFCGK